MELKDKEVINTYKIIEDKENKIMRKYNLFEDGKLVEVDRKHTTDKSSFNEE